MGVKLSVDGSGGEGGGQDESIRNSTMKTCQKDREDPELLLPLPKPSASAFVPLNTL